jgi:hypothetical protein
VSQNASMNRRRKTLTGIFAGAKSVTYTLVKDTGAGRSVTARVTLTEPEHNRQMAANIAHHYRHKAQKESP